MVSKLHKLSIYLGYGDAGDVLEKQIRAEAEQRKKNVSRFIMEALEHFCSSICRR